MRFNPSNRQHRAGLATVPAWVLVGAVVILLAIVVTLAVRNFNREKQHMADILSEKGAALIRAFESGARTGMMDRMWGKSQAQTLLEEMARQPGILYMVITDRDGRILADNDRIRIGGQFLNKAAMESLRPGMKERWRLAVTADGRQAFEVFRYFRPLGGGDSDAWRRTCRHEHGAHGSMGRDWTRGCCSSRNAGGSGGGVDADVIFVGLDVAPFEAARQEDIRNTIVISAVLVLLGLGGFLSLFWIQNYQTTRRLLQDTSAFATEVVANLPVGVIATGPDGRIAFLNEAAEAITGHTFEAARGTTPDRILPEDWDSLKRLLDKGKTLLEREMECSFSGGGSVPLSVSGTRIVNEEGYLVGHLLILRDLREVRSLQEEIRRQEKLAALGGMAAGIAHEIRNPLSSIKGLATLFNDRFEEGSEEKEAAGVMLREVDRLNRVISELLEFARPSDLKPKAVDLNELLEHSVRLVQQDAKGKAIRIELSPYSGLPPVPIDPDRFSQAVLNLFLNAIQAMDKGGVLSIETSLSDDLHVMVRVADTGGGISPRDLGKIFDPYFTTKPTGTGLGLAIVHKIIEAHKGKVRVESAVGKGTVFTILIPLSADKAAAEQTHDGS